MERVIYIEKEDGIDKYIIKDINLENIEKFKKKLKISCGEYEDISTIRAKGYNLETFKENLKITNSKQYTCELVDYRELPEDRKKTYINVNYTICRYPNLISIINKIVDTGRYSGEYLEKLLTKNTNDELLPVSVKLQNALKEIDVKDIQCSKLEELKRLITLYERNMYQKDVREYYEEALALFPYELTDTLSKDEYEKVFSFFDEKIDPKKYIHKK